MKNITRIISLISVSLLLLTFLGCKKKLTEYNPTGLTSEAVYTTPTGFEGLVNSAYSYSRWWYGKEEGYSLSEAGTDIWTNGSADVFPDLSLYTNLNGNNAAITMEWRQLYAAVNLCNLGIKGVANSGLGSLIPQREAELRFLRAFYYWHIVETWGGVHFTTEPTTAETPPTANKTPVSTFYDLILSDLQFAVQNLPASSSASVVTGRITKSGAEAFLARMYLTRGMYTEALQSAKNVIDNPLFALEPKFADLWDMTKPQSKEVIWIVNYSTNLVLNDKWDATLNPYGYPGRNVDRGSNNGHLMFLSVYDQGIPAALIRDIPNGRPFNRYMPTKFLLFAFDETKDSRYNGSFQWVWKSNQTPLAGPYRGKIVIGDTALVVTKVVKTDQSKYAVKDVNSMFKADGSTNNKFYYPNLKKFMDPTRDAIPQAQSARDVFVLRLAEMHFIAAEASLQLGDLGNAKTHLDVIRKRAALPGVDYQVNESEITLDFILDEKAREFAGEQIRWFDLKRTGKLVSRIRTLNPDAAANIQDYHTVRPIPRAQIDAVTNKDEFTQNPGYAQ